MSFQTYVALGIVASTMMVVGATLVGIGARHYKSASVHWGAVLMVAAIVVASPLFTAMSAAS